MICFCAERFHWRRIWQNPGELLMPGFADMATRALLYRRPAEPSRLLVKHGSQIYSVRLRRHRRARRYTLRIHPSDREAILTMPPRGTIADAKDFAQRHGGWIAARLGRLQKAAQAYAQAMGVRVKRLSIRDQSSRWGSCTSAGSLSFSWRLILAPPYVLDYLAGHEAAHLVEMSHSPRFWRVVGRVCGHVERAKTWLDTYGIQD